VDFWGFNIFSIRLTLVGFVGAIMLGGGSLKVDFTFGEAKILARWSTVRLNNMGRVSPPTA
jgi:hypothetical protein